jgi:pimeloyl-ACP methyl ester carboxylesterase
MPTADSHGIKIHYQDEGKGPPMLLLHSFLCSGEMWREQVAPLAQGHRVLNVDLRGHGSSGPIERPFELRELVDDALAVLDDAGVERAYWAGLSVGGMTALRAALEQPERVRGLLLLNTDAGAEAGWHRFRFRLMGMLARLLGMRALGGEVTRVMFGPTVRQRNPELAEEWRGKFVSGHLPSTLAMLEALMRRDDLLPYLGRIYCPTLVVGGSEDRALPIERSRRIAAALPHARFVRLEETGHLSALEHPRAVTGVMVDFLDSLESGKG